MLSHLADTVVPVFGRLDVTTDAGPFAGMIIANHTSLSDPVIVLAALRRLVTEPSCWQPQGCGASPCSAVSSRERATSQFTGTTHEPPKHCEKPKTH